MPGPQSETKDRDDTAAEPGDTNGQPLLTLRDSWWATIAGEWPNRELIHYLDSPAMRRAEAERVVMDYERQREASAADLKLIETQAEVNAEHARALEHEGLAENARRWEAAVTPIRIAAAFAAVKRQAMTKRVSILIQQIAIIRQNGGADAEPLLPLPSPGIAALPGPADLSVRVDHTMPLPEIEPPTDEEQQRWNTWAQDPSAPAPATASDLIPGMSDQPGSEDG